jgi:hypothetical protein
MTRHRFDEPIELGPLGGGDDAHVLGGDGIIGLPDIEFACPTTRFYDDAGEGKPGAGGPATRE